jgi:coproporphyrinogen III oxidase-like Fe-S oxidoreductase
VSSPLGIKVHVPFCAVRCGYCDFIGDRVQLTREGRLFADAVVRALSGVRGRVPPSAGGHGRRPRL